VQVATIGNVMQVTPSSIIIIIFIYEYKAKEKKYHTFIGKDIGFLYYDILYKTKFS